MGISFGSTSKKPYVGSKEVQEAYVGNQLVYKAAPPYIYAFLGEETSYYLADWASLQPRPNDYPKTMEITKDGGVFRATMGQSFSCFGMNQIPTRKLKFIVRSNASGGQYYQGLEVLYTTYSYTSKATSLKYFTVTPNYQLCEVNIPEAAKVILIGKSINTPGVSFFLDEIRFEPV